MRKKLSICVRPGVDEVRASPRTPKRELIRLDLPTLERPRKAISGVASCSQSLSFSALLRNSALVIFIGQRAPPSSRSKMRLRLAATGSGRGLLRAHCLNLFEPLAHAGHTSFNVRHAFHDSFEILG